MPAIQRDAITRSKGLLPELNTPIAITVSRRFPTLTESRTSHPITCFIIVIAESKDPSFSRVSSFVYSTCRATIIDSDDGYLLSPSSLVLTCYGGILAGCEKRGLTDGRRGGCWCDRESEILALHHDSTGNFFVFV